MTTKQYFRILIIDDNVDIHQDFIKILSSQSSTKKIDTLEEQLFGEDRALSQQAQFKLDAVDQGVAGLEMVASALASKQPYALAFVDIRMPPGWDGIETVKKIWEIDKDIQIVICTAYSDYTWEETVSNLGQTDNLLILKKPFDSIAVRQLACALTKKWQLTLDARNYTQSLERSVEARTYDLQQSLSLVKATLESSTDGILVINEKGKVVDYNSRLNIMWALRKGFLEKTNFSAFVLHIVEQLTDPEKFIKKTKEICSAPEAINLDIIKFKCGRVFEFYSQPQILKGKNIGRVWSFRDITQRATLEEKLHFQATHDSLTGLPNRMQLDDYMRQLVFSYQKSKTNFSILFFDLDRFKLINDSLSHAVGDELLRSLAERLKVTIHSNHILSRVSGDEFLIIIPNEKDQAILSGYAAEILNVISKPFHIENREIFISASMGVATFPKDGSNFESLLRSADAAMYASKKSGTNRFQFYNEKMNEDHLLLLEKETELRHALKNNEFVLYYQPQVDLESEKLVAVEALIRWNHPTKGLLQPADFIEIAENTGLIIPIGEWVLRTACKQNKDWQDSGLPPIRMAVNVTSPQLHQFNFVKTVVDVLQETGLKPEHLELELKENSIVNNTTVIDAINALKALGVCIALDDFGTGYSSLNYLRHLPIDRLKIDKTFVQNIKINRGDEVIIHAIISMARSLNFEVLAEGVETQSQLAYLKSQRCGEIQGFYFSKPIPPADLENLLKEAVSINKILFQQNE